MLLMVAKAIIAFVGLLAAGGIVADFFVPASASEHMRNARWRPHAKFHNAQGFLMGILLAGLTQWLLFGPIGTGFVGLLTAAAVASVFWISMAGAILFPDTAWRDPEFAHGGAPGRPAPLIAASSCLAGLAIALVLAAAYYYR